MIPTRSEALEAAAWDKNSQRFGDFLKRCEPDIKSHPRMRQVPQYDVDDIVQTIFRKLIVNYSYRGQSEFNTWLFTIVGNEISQYYRKRSRDRLLTNQEILQKPYKSSDGLEALIIAEDRQRLGRALDQYPDKAARRVFDLLQDGEHSIAEAAEKTGHSKDALKSKLHRIRVYLNNRLNDSDSHSR